MRRRSSTHLFTQAGRAETQPVALPLVLLFAPLIAVGADVAAPSRPNIVVILADDMHWHLPGFHGGNASTPNLDRLAREGTRLSQFYVHAVCSPTRAAFLTGRYPFRNGMEERSHGNDTAGMLPDERTLAEAPKEIGYDTALIGKWHLGNWYQRQLPLQRGFDYHYGLYGALVSYYTKVRGTCYDWHRNGKPVREEGYTTDLLAREVESLLADRRSERPFFYYIAFNAVHGPDEAPAELAEKYRTLYAGSAGVSAHAWSDFVRNVAHQKNTSRSRTSDCSSWEKTRTPIRLPGCRPTSSRFPEPRSRSERRTRDENRMWAAPSGALVPKTGSPVQSDTITLRLAAYRRLASRKGREVSNTTSPGK